MTLSKKVETKTTLFLHSIFQKCRRVSAIRPARIMLPLLDWSQLTLLASGGVAYTAGAVIFALERPNPWLGHFGHHEVWHLFVLAGAAAHFGFVWSFVGLDYPPF